MGDEEWAARLAANLVLFVLGTTPKLGKIMLIIEKSMQHFFCFFVYYFASDICSFVMKPFININNKSLEQYQIESQVY